MGTFNNDDGFTTGFLGDKKKNTKKTTNGLSSLFDDQSLNLSDTQRIRTFNQQSNDPDSLTFNSGRQRNYNNAPKFNGNQVFTDNSVPKQWQNDNQSPFNRQMPKQQVPNNQNNNFNSMQPVNVETPNMEVQQIRVDDFAAKKEMPKVQPDNLNQPQPVENNQQPVEFESAPQVPDNSKSMPIPIVQNINQDNANKTGAKISEKNKKDLSKILNISSLAVLSILIIFVVLISTGVISLKKNNNSNNEKVVVNTEEQKIEGMISKLNASCNHLDAEGNYGSKPEGVDESCKEITCYIVDNVICANGLCIISDGKTVYSKTCGTGSIKRVNANDFQASINLGELCATIMSDSSLAGGIETGYGSCQNFLCETTVNGKSYTQVCKGNS